MLPSAIILQVASPDYSGLLDLTRENSFAYCARHGLRFFGRPLEAVTCRDRLEWIIKTLHHADWLWYLGADTLITNHMTDVRRVLSQFNADDSADLLIAHDVNGLNNDSFLIRNCPASVAFLSAAAEMQSHAANDQVAMDWLIRHGRIATAIIPQRAINSYDYSLYNYTPEQVAAVGGSWQPGDLLLHVPGLPFAKREQVIREHLPMVLK